MKFPPWTTKLTFRALALCQSEYCLPNLLATLIPSYLPDYCLISKYRGDSTVSLETNLSWFVRQTDWLIVSILKPTYFSATLSKDTNDTLKVSTSLFPVPHKETEDDGGSEPEKTTERSETTDLPVYEKPWLWAIVAFPVVIIALPIVIITAVRYRQGSNEKSHDPVGEGDQLIQRPRGQAPPRGE